MLDQAERLGHAGAWECDAATGSFTWSDGARRLVAIDPDPGPPARPREPSRGAGARGRPGDAENVEAVRAGVPHVLEEDRHMAAGEWGVSHSGSERRSVIGAIRDVTQEREARSSALHAAGHDLPTDLPNRRALYARLDAAFHKRGVTGALTLFQIDRLNEVSSTMGHAFGDSVLRVFARRLHERARGHFVARTAATSSALLVEDCDPMRAQGIACAFVSGLREPMEVFGRPTAIGISAGTAAFPGDGVDSME